jgi:hypothetical protein
MHTLIHTDGRGMYVAEETPAEFAERVASHVSANTAFIKVDDAYIMIDKIARWVPWDCSIPPGGDF